MALSAVENLLFKARNATQEDVDQLCKNIADLLVFPDKASECSALLRQLFLLLQSSDVEPCIPKNLLSEMLKALSKPETEKSLGKQCTLCSLILKELASGQGQLSEDLSVSKDRPPQKQLLSCYTLQGTKQNCLQEILPYAVRWLCKTDLDSQRKALSFLVAVSSLHGILNQDEIGDTSEQICSWLMNASLYQARNTYSINPFRKDEDTQVTEIDGTSCRNFFTVLNIGQYCTEDQYLNIYSFSILYKWLYHCSTQSQPTSAPQNIASGAQSDDSSVSGSAASSLAKSSTSQKYSFEDGTDGSFRKSVLASSVPGSPMKSVAPGSPFKSTPPAGSPMKAALGVEGSPGRKMAASGEGGPAKLGAARNVKVSRVLRSLLSRSIDYCFRLMDQCERKAKVASDAELQTACLTEVVVILDLLCKLDAGQIPRVHQEMRRLFTRVSNDAAYSTTVLKILQFFLNHSVKVVHDPQEVYNHFFSTVLTQQFSDPGLAFDTVVFICDNISTLCYSTNILSKFFPNIFKILAWHPRTFLKEFMMILPAMMSPTTSLEIFHILLDLPCMTAALEVMERVKKVEPAFTMNPAGAGEPTSSIEAYNTLRYKPLFNFITRDEGGQGDTVSKLSSLHTVLEDTRNSARVYNVSQCVPVLLRRWFNIIMTEAEEEYATQILPALLERSGLLFELPDFKHDLVMILGEHLLQLVERYPAVLVEHVTDVTEFVHNTSNLRGRQNFYGNLIYCIGEFCSADNSPSFTPELIAQFFDILEVVTYEICGTALAEEEEVPVHPKIFTLLMTTMAKLSTRRQDLIPRAILCLTKVAKQHFALTQDPLAQDAIVACAQERVNLLKQPNFAVSILNPSDDIYSGSWHTDGYSLPLLTRTINRVINWK